MVLAAFARRAPCALRGTVRAALRPRISSIAARALSLSAVRFDTGSKSVDQQAKQEQQVDPLNSAANPAPTPASQQAAQHQTAGEESVEAEQEGEEAEQEDEFYDPEDAEAEAEYQAWIDEVTKAYEAHTGEFVHAPLRYLHPATRALPLHDPEGTAEQELLDPNQVSMGEDIPILPAESVEDQYVPLSSWAFSVVPRRDVLYAAVKYHLDSLRRGTASAKSRGEVAFSRRKIRPQKGTGRARVSDRGSPAFKGGGVSHGPRPRDYSTDLPRQVRELALRSALSAKWMAGELDVVRSLVWDHPPGTVGALRKALVSRGYERNTLFLTAPRSPEPGTLTRVPALGAGDYPPLPARRRAMRASARDPTYPPERIESHIKALRGFELSLRPFSRDYTVLHLPKLKEAQEHHLLYTRGKQWMHRNGAFKRPSELPAYTILRARRVVMDLGALEWIEEKLGGARFHRRAVGEDQDPKLLEYPFNPLLPAHLGAPDIDAVNRPNPEYDERLLEALEKRRERMSKAAKAHEARINAALYGTDEDQLLDDDDAFKYLEQSKSLIAETLSKVHAWNPAQAEEYKAS